MLSVIIPAYNEEKTIQICYEKIKSLFITNDITNCINSYEIIFVDDGSTDTTW